LFSNDVSLASADSILVWRVAVALELLELELVVFLSELDSPRHPESRSDAATTAQSVITNTNRFFSLAPPLFIDPSVPEKATKRMQRLQLNYHLYYSLFSAIEQLGHSSDKDHEFAIKADSICLLDVNAFPRLQTEMHARQRTCLISDYQR
jgi:hypothetical protein